MLAVTTSSDNNSLDHVALFAVAGVMMRLKEVETVSNSYFIKYSPRSPVVSPATVTLEENGRDSKGLSKWRCWYMLAIWMQKYADALEARPLAIQCLTSAIIGALGDVLSQEIQSAMGGDALWHDSLVSMVATDDGEIMHKHALIL